MTRDYQQEDIDSVFDHWLKYRSTLGVAGTGLGKTYIMVEVAIRMLKLNPGKRVILLAHRSELIFQARLAFLRAGLEVEIEKGELAAGTSLFSAPVVIATVQTMGNGEPDKKRMHRFNPDEFCLLLYDESHHAVSVGNKKIVEWFLQNPLLKVLGVTATYQRADGVALGQIFESTAFKRDILFGIENGWLVRPDQLSAHIGCLDFSHVKTVDGDLNPVEMKAIMEAEEPSQKVVQATLEAMFEVPQNSLYDLPKDEWAKHLLAARKPKRTIVFTVSVKQAETLSNIFNRVIPGLSSWVCGDTPDGERDLIFKDFNSGRCSILVNCGVTTEGYDNPAVELIVMARLTKSVSLYIQMVGRATRPLPGIVDGLESKEERLAAIASSAKPRAVVLDIVGNAGRHKLAMLPDVLGGKHTPAAVERAKERVKEAKTPMQVKDVIEEEEEKIRQEIERKRLAEEAKKRRLVARARYRTTEINPFNTQRAEPQRKNGYDYGKKLTEGQKQVLRDLPGVDPDNIPYGEGKRMLIAMFKSREKAPITPNQTPVILKFYPEKDITKMTKNEATKLITAVAKNNWRRP